MVSSRSAGSLPSVTAPQCGQDSGTQRGFLPTPDPLQALPSGYAAWDEVGRDLPKLLAAGRARTVLEQLPILDADGLPDEAVHRAMLLLSFFGHAYVHQTWRTASAQRLPSVLARPWAQVARRLGEGEAEYFWIEMLMPYSNVTVFYGHIQNFLGGLDEEWFVTVHVEIEAEAAAALVALPLAQQAAASGNRPALDAALAAVVASMGRMHQTLQRMPENCDPYIYYNRVRPFIHGWQQAPVVYEGVAEYEEAPQTFYGETGAQSTVVPCLDAVLGIGHQPDELRTYLRGMRTYMPPPHVAFLDRLEEGPSVRAFVAGADDSELRGVYDAAVAGVEAFRSTHLEYAARYIQKQAQVGVNSTVYGTGGTPFMRYLKKHRDETRRHRLDH